MPQPPNLDSPTSSPASSTSQLAATSKPPVDNTRPVLVQLVNLVNVALAQHHDLSRRLSIASSGLECGCGGRTVSARSAQISASGDLDYLLSSCTGPHDGDSPSKA
ncbi:hypothetical protein JCM8208_005447 [Rhodotorula glutinis]